MLRWSHAITLTICTIWFIVTFWRIRALNVSWVWRCACIEEEPLWHINNLAPVWSRLLWPLTAGLEMVTIPVWADLLGEVIICSSRSLCLYNCAKAFYIVWSQQWGANVSDRIYSNRISISSCLWGRNKKYINTNPAFKTSMVIRTCVFV